MLHSLLEDGDLGEMSRLVKLVILIRAPCQWPELKAVTSSTERATWMGRQVAWWGPALRMTELSLRAAW